MPRALAEIIAHIRSVCDAPSVDATLIQTADLYVLCDAAETCVAQGVLIDRLHEEIAELRRLDKPVTAAAQANAKEIVRLVSDVTSDLHADICAENDNLKAENKRLRAELEMVSK